MAVLHSRRAVLVVFGISAAAALTTTLVDSATASTIVNAVLLLGLPAAGILFIRRSRNLEKAEHRAWLLVGLGLLIASVGVIVLTVTWLIHSSVSAFSPIDSIYLVGYFVGLAGFAILPHTYGNGLVRLRLLLDGLIGAVAVGALIWTLLLREITSSLAEAPLTDQLIGATFIFLDIALLVVLMIVVVRRSSVRFDLRLVLFGLAGISQAIADFSYLTSGAGKAFAEAEPIYPFNIAAVGFFLAAALVVDITPSEREYADRTRTPTWALILPYSFAVVLVGVLVARFPNMGASVADQGLFHATVLVAVLVITRQALAIRENRRAVEDQRTALVGSISHELRTPLTAIIGFLEILRDEEYASDAERREITDIATDQASYLSRVVSDLVMLASETITNVDLDINQIPIDELVWRSVNVASVDATNVRVEPERNTTAFVDSGRMTQALANLITNAERYGRDRVTIIARSSNGALVLEVHDNGPGVPRKYELLIWEKFERGPNRLNATVPGSGIGLAVTDAIAKAHGGTVGYRRSERLGGACFWIRLPGRIHTTPETRPATADPLRRDEARSA